MIAAIGGTGNLGFVLAWRWTRGGHEVIVGSRAEDKVQQAASEINKRMGNDSVLSKDNVAVVNAAEIIALTVLYAAHAAITESINSLLSIQILIDTTGSYKATQNEYEKILQWCLVFFDRMRAII